MEIEAASATHVGLVRGNNEDSLHRGRWCFAVADGLGGHAGGEVASAIAVEELAALERAEPPGSPEEVSEALRSAVRRASRAVFEAARRDPGLQGMGTTLTAAGRCGNSLCVAHVGDSRAYLLRAGRLVQLTSDHAVGPYTLTRVVGLDPDVEVDTPEPVALEPGDRLLLCTDGLTAVLDGAPLAAALAGGSAQQAADALVRLALEGGGPDNVAVVVLAVTGSPGG